MTSLALAVVLLWTLVAVVCSVVNVALLVLAWQSWQVVKRKGALPTDGRRVLARMVVEQAFSFTLLVGMLALFAVLVISSLMDGWPPARLLMLYRFSVSSVVLVLVTCLQVRALRDWRRLLLQAEADIAQEEDETS